MLTSSSTRIRRTIEPAKIHCNLPYLGDNSTDRLYNTGVIVKKKTTKKEDTSSFFVVRRIEK